MAKGPFSNVNPQDIAAIDLGRVLPRLEHKILSADAGPRLLHSSYERTQTAATLEYARTLLLRLEHASSSIKLPSKRHATKTDLFAHRALLKRLTDRLHDLETQADADANDPFYGPEDGDALFISNDDPTTTPQNPTHTTPSSPPSTLRNRHNHPPPPFPPPPTQAALLTASDTETTTLTTSLLTLARALKASSTHFAATLETDTQTLSRATEGLDKNASGMEAAGRRMGLLKRMSEGKGWWGRMMLYAWIAGLWVLALLLVFVGPKLRF